MKIKKGDSFVCIKEVKMDSGVIEYLKGVVYHSDIKHCITDQGGNARHVWSDLADKYFVKLK